MTLAPAPSAPAPVAPSKQRTLTARAGSFTCHASSPCCRCAADSRRRKVPQTSRRFSSRPRRRAPRAHRRAHPRRACRRPDHRRRGARGPRQDCPSQGSSERTRPAWRRARRRAHAEPRAKVAFLRMGSSSKPCATALMERALPLAFHSMASTIGRVSWSVVCPEVVASPTERKVAPASMVTESVARRACGGTADASESACHPLSDCVSPVPGERQS